MILGLNPRSLCKAINDNHPRGKAIWFDSREWKTPFLRVLGEWRCHQGIIVVKDLVKVQKPVMVTKPVNTFLLDTPWAIARDTVWGTACAFHSEGKFYCPTDSLGGFEVVSDEFELAVCWSLFNYALKAKEFVGRNEEAKKIGHPQYAVEASDVVRFDGVEDDRTWNYFSPPNPPKWEARK